LVLVGLELVKSFDESYRVVLFLFDVSLQLFHLLKHFIKVLIAVFFDGFDEFLILGNHYVLGYAEDSG
jgi:hypothetical protein